MLGVVAVVVAGGAVASGVVIADRASAADPPLTAVARSTDVIRSVSGTGTLVDQYTYAVDADGTATLTARAGASTGSTGSSTGGAGGTGGTGGGGGSAQAGAGSLTVDSVSVEPGQRLDRGDRIARVERADGSLHDVDAPVSGHVRSVSTAAHADAGRLVTIGAGRVLAALEISENQIAEVRSGQRVAITLAAGTATTTGVVDAVEQVPDASSGALRYPVLVRLDRIPSGARIGMTATGAITTAHADDVVAVPAAAIEGAGQDLRVRVVDGDATRAVPIEIGLVGDTAVEVRSGPRAGQRVVVGASGEVAATTRRLGPPTSVTGASPTLAATGGSK
ncbi:HlyD family efflux transporter periplasmic adaptor subunit [Amnibacterium setariae]|uniref:HlyD family efflux transporter periplasmic adaptor subunit n=1 Tax=Amnibacterium setariae TaxID=2306585 RepID=A0A3A1TW87_9MICO|nr:HlyD family efflux transporter periplasmic adaptor subunit [Amnibacterium setariae]